ncbi:regulation of mRNA processing [Mactra antiquata]
MNRYLEDQDKSTFQTLSYNAAGEMLLSMLHIHKQDQLAYSWFLDEKCNVNIFGRNKECFLLMMDLLYECGRYQDVLSLLSQSEQYIDRRFPDLVTITLAALYKLNTPDSLAQLHTLLGELCLNPIQLTSRSAMYCALLAYNQGDIDMIREIPHLPLFAMCYRKMINPLSNIDILTYTELGRYEDAVDILKDVIVRFKKSAYIFFPEVIAKLESAVMSTDNIRLQDEFKVVHKALKLGQFMYYSSMDEFLSRQVSYKEYDMLMNTKNPRQFNKQTFAFKRSSESNKTLLTEAKQIT